MKNITLGWLEDKNACLEGRQWFSNQSSTSVISIINKLLKEQRFEWASWTITKLFTRRQSVLFACYAARRSLKYFESKYPDNKRPLEAIKAAEKWLKHPTKENKVKARSAAAWQDMLLFGLKLCLKRKVK